MMLESLTQLSTCFHSAGVSRTKLPNRLGQYPVPISVRKCEGNMDVLEKVCPVLQEVSAL